MQSDGLSMGQVAGVDTVDQWRNTLIDSLVSLVQTTTDYSGLVSRSGWPAWERARETPNAATGELVL